MSKHIESQPAINQNQVGNINLVDASITTSTVKNKHAFVLWSGGIDSTYLITHLLEQGYRVDAGYIKIIVNKEQSVRELAAIERLLPLIDNNNFKYLGILNELNIVNSGNVILNQIPMFLTALYHLGPYDEFATGFIMNDDTISWIPDIVACYNGFKPLVRNLPTITFPLIKLKKMEILRRLPDVLKENVVWCEDEDGLYQPEINGCNTCHSCLRMDYEQRVDAAPW
ncbi:MAG: hypothetical protein HXX17_07130 [Geobacteraceae bacterium]|nr:hypothetical protein [Geobacteraceae bacterium]